MSLSSESDWIKCNEICEAHWKRTMHLKRSFLQDPSLIWHSYCNINLIISKLHRNGEVTNEFLPAQFKRSSQDCIELSVYWRQRKSNALMRRTVFAIETFWIFNCRLNLTLHSDANAFHDWGIFFWICSGTNGLWINWHVSRVWAQ